MQISIEIVDVNVATKTSSNNKPYSMATIAYKDQGKLKEKKLLGFGAQQEAFKVISKANKGDSFIIDMEKNADGYWDWLKATSGSAASAPAASGANASPQRGNWETPEERMARQAYIIRQSSLSNAIEFLNHTKKSYDLSEILTVANVFEEFVFGKTVTKQAPGDDIHEMDDDVPL